MAPFNYDGSFNNKTLPPGTEEALFDVVFWGMVLAMNEEVRYAIAPATTPPIRADLGMVVVGMIVVALCNASQAYEWLGSVRSTGCENTEESLQYIPIICDACATA